MKEPRESTPERAESHKWYEDALALIIGSFLLSVGVVLFSQNKLLPGGVAGLSLVLSYATPLPFGVYFSLINAPFYFLSVARMGWEYTIKTIIAVTIVSILPEHLHFLMTVQASNPLIAGIIAGIFIGLGMLILFRHRAGIGGSSILASYLQDKNVLRAGYFLLIFDLGVMLLSVFFIPLLNIFYSLIAAAVLNLQVAVNHKPGRYAVIYK